MATTSATAAKHSATISHDPQAPASKLSKKSTSGELEFLLESLTHPLPMHCTCIEYILSGPEHACLKRRIAKLLNVRYEPERELDRCMCGRARKPSGSGTEMWEAPSEDRGCLCLQAEMNALKIKESPRGSNLLLVETSNAEEDPGIDGQEDEDEGYLLVEPMSYTSDGGSETGATMGVGSDADNAMIWDDGDDPEEVTYCEEHGGKEGGLKGKCDTCRELYGSEGICKEHGGWEGNQKRFCDACKEVYGDPYEVRIVPGLGRR